MSTGDHPPTGHRRLVYLVGLLVLVGIAAPLFRKPVQRAFLLHSILRVDAPSESAFQELADGAREPFEFLQRVWNTLRIPQRVLVAAYLKDRASTNPELYQQAKSLLIAATQDVDFSVRELALAALAQQKHPALAILAASLLRDADPETRLLGLQYLRRQDPTTALPVVFGLLDDPDLRVVTGADSALRTWTQQDFGIRLSQISFNVETSNSSVDPAHLKTIQEGVQRWKEWRNDQDHLTDPLPAPVAAVTPQRLPAADFALKDLTGKTVRFSDFGGKVVLLNFWTTWCPGCQTEISNLIELQTRNANRLVILGISLDGQTAVDEHGHLVGTHFDDGDDHAEDDAPRRIDLAQLRAKVDRFVKDKGVNYLVLLDPDFEIGRRFNGGELPVNVLIDPKGYLRRRFIGGRNVAVLQAMIDELYRPVP